MKARYSSRREPMAGVKEVQMSTGEIAPDNKDRPPDETQIRRAIVAVQTT
jgi:hypothetical protein